MKTPKDGDLSELIQAAEQRWPEILQAFGFPAEMLDGKHHPCPKCGGNDRFRFIDAKSGAVLCNQCFSKKNGDGISAIMWLRDLDFNTARTAIANHLGVGSRDKGMPSSDPFSAIALQKRISVSGMQDYGAKVATRGKAQVVRFPVYNERREPFSYFDLVPSGHAKGLFKRGRGNAGMFFPGRCSKPGETWFLVEGVKDAVALHDLGFLAAGMPTSQLASKYVPLFNGVEIVLAPDRDKAGETGANATASRVYLTAKSVRVVRLPVDYSQTKGKDVRDVLALQDGERLLRRAIKEAQAWRPEDNGGKSRPIIAIGVDEDRVVSEAVQALAAHSEIYQRGGILLHVVRDVRPSDKSKPSFGMPRITQVRLPRLREMLATAAEWVPASEEADKSIHPPEWVVMAVNARGQWKGIRPIEGVTQVPVLRADGSIIQQEGYDPSTGLLYIPVTAYPPIPSQLTIDDAQRALHSLLEVIQDFPFSSDAHKSAMIAGMLTPFARFAFSGPAPMFLIDANVRGCGKSLLTDCIAVLFSGAEMARMSAIRNDDEMRKRITALALGGEPLILIDNIVGSLGGASLDAALTATFWSDRILGQSATIKIPLRATWYGTGNNIILAVDTARRCLHVRLESLEENPEERSNFQQPRLLCWLHRERPRLVVAALTILRSYCAAGRPSMGLRPWGSFEGWSDLLRQSIVWCGLEDPGLTRTELRTQADRESAVLCQLIQGWLEIDPKGEGQTVADALKLLDANPDQYETLRSAIFELVDTKAGKPPSARSLGMKLHYLRRRVIRGRFIDKKDSRKGAIWYVQEAPLCRTSGTSGTNSGPSRVHARTCNDDEPSGNSGASPASPADGNGASTGKVEGRMQFCSDSESFTI